MEEHSHHSESATLDECSTLIEGEYSLAWHIAAIFIIMFFSFTGTLIPILFKKYFSTKSLVFTVGKLFGAGIILATAWVHMQTEASEILASPCLPEGFHKYHALSGVLAMVGILFTHLIQVVANEYMSSVIKKQSHADNLKIPSPDKTDSNKTWTSEHSIKDKEESNHDEICVDHDHNLEKGPHIHVMDSFDHGHDHSHGGALMHSQELAVYLLEFGIASHSIIIGITLGATRTDFIPLLVALTFHQFFEGIALSSVVIEAEFKKRLIAIFMVIFYTLSTPIGIAIGVGLNASFSSNATEYLITQGILDSLACGILIYDGLVNIIVPHFNGNTYRNASQWKQFIQFCALWAGAGIMSVVGIWA